MSFNDVSLRQSGDIGTDTSMYGDVLTVPKHKLGESVQIFAEDGVSVENTGNMSIIGEKRDRCTPKTVDTDQGRRSHRNSSSSR